MISPHRICLYDAAKLQYGESFEPSFLVKVIGCDEYTMDKCLATPTKRTPLSSPCERY